MVMLRVGQSFHHDTEKLTEHTLALNLDIATEALLLVVDALKQRGLLSESCDKKRVYMPGKSLEHITIQEIWDAVRCAQESPHLNPQNISSDTSVDGLLESINLSVSNTVNNQTLLDLVTRSNP